MRLSDKIALGRVLIRHSSFTLVGEAGCAMGMALRAQGFEGDGRLDDAINELEGAQFFVVPPECCEQLKREPGPLYKFIVHLNDRHIFKSRDWTLDQLIDYVRSVEPPELDRGADCLPQSQKAAAREVSDVRT